VRDLDLFTFGLSGTAKRGGTKLTPLTAGMHTFVLCPSPKPLTELRLPAKAEAGAEDAGGVAEQCADPVCEAEKAEGVASDLARKRCGCHSAVLRMDWRAVACFAVRSRARVL
jgi:hypothetical protein